MGSTYYGNLYKIILYLSGHWVLYIQLRKKMNPNTLCCFLLDQPAKLFSKVVPNHGLKSKSLILNTVS